MQLGFSPCPNDTFIFYALVHGKVPSPAPIEPVLADVETLNAWAFEGRLPATKLSYAAFAQVKDRYLALRSGGALGRGVGPLVVAKEERPLEAARVAHPGEATTAYALFRMYMGDRPFTPVPMVYNEIMPAVARGEVDLGLIIHESRFVYPEYGLKKLLDLGEWWEAETGLPLPLGLIAVRRDLGEGLAQALDEAIRESIRYAWDHPGEVLEYMKAHAQEMGEDVIWQHVKTYVNDFSLDLGEEGRRAAEALFARMEAVGLVPRQDSTGWLVGER